MNMAPPASPVERSRAWAKDVTGAIALAEGAVARRILLGMDGIEVPATNVFGERVVVERSADVADLARAAAEAAATGERVALVARAADLAAARGELARIAARRLGVVVHVVADAAGPMHVARAQSSPPGALSSTPSPQAGLAPALALADIGWAMLLACGVADALDLALVARRAAEDSGCPFFVVHERGPAHHVEHVAAPSRELCEAFVGAPAAAPSRLEPAESERAVAERVPFALSSAMRELESLTGRPHDVIERVPASDAALAFVGAGALGESVVAEVARLRGAGHDVGAVRVVSWRPFPGARLVKALSRALAITVLDSVDRPLAPSSPLAEQVEAVFAKALTWAPDYPGIGRIPRIVSGVAAREIDSSDLDAMVRNMLADERGRRLFVLGGGGASPALPAAEFVREAHDHAFAMRGLTTSREVAVACAELCAAVLASALGVRARVSVRTAAPEEGGGVAFDLLASRDRPRGAHAPHAARLVAMADASAFTRGNPIARLATGGMLAVPTMQRSADAVWAEVPSWAKAVVFDRTARVVGWSPTAHGDDAWVIAGAFAGLALAEARGDMAVASGRTIDVALVAREVTEALRLATADTRDPGSLGAGADGTGAPRASEPVVERGARAACDAFEAHVEVPRATIEREDDAVRLGRRDARASAS
jgi:pyruvate/2-oxoacid:ferredoxin oxidoreductase alpha subunit